MKNFLKNAFLVVLVVLLAATFLEKSQSQVKTSLENNVIIVDKGEAITDESSEEDTIYLENESSNIFSRIGAVVSNLFSKIAEFVSKIIGSVFIFMPTYLEIY